MIIFITLFSDRLFKINNKFSIRGWSMREKKYNSILLMIWIFFIHKMENPLPNKTIFFPRFLVKKYILLVPTINLYIISKQQLELSFPLPNLTYDQDGNIHLHPILVPNYSSLSNTSYPPLCLFHIELPKHHDQLFHIGHHWNTIGMRFV